MGQNNRPKLELQPGEEVKVTLLQDKPATGRSDFGPYNAYSVAVEDGTEMVFFATPNIHQIIEEQKLGKGSQFVLRRPVQTNGRKPKLEIALISKEQVAEPRDDLKAMLLQSIRDAADIVREAGIQFSNDEIQKLATTLFIQRTRLA
jgi:hypothetical protein